MGLYDGRKARRTQVQTLSDEEAEAEKRLSQKEYNDSAAGKGRTRKYREGEKGKQTRSNKTKRDSITCGCGHLTSRNHLRRQARVAGSKRLSSSLYWEKGKTN